MNNRILKIIYIFIAFFFLGLGALGVILPVLPTTPFLLLASYFFAKGSKRFNNWFLSTKLYKTYLKDFVRDRTMELRTKMQILIFASSMLLLAVYTVDKFFVRLIIGFIIIYKYYYFIFKIKTIKPDDLKTKDSLKPKESFEKYG